MIEPSSQNVQDPVELTRGKPLFNFGKFTPTSLLLMLVIFLTALSYSATPQFGFVFDDKTVVVQNPFIRAWSNVPQYFTTKVLTFDPTGAVLNYYRPIFLLWLRLNYAWFGLHAAGWHLTTLALHLLVTWMVYLLARRLTGDAGLAVVAAAVFGLHPVHLESVAWVSGVTDPLVTTPMLASFLIYLYAKEPGRSKAWWVLILTLHAVAMLAKENAVVLPLLVLAHEWIWRREDSGHVISTAGRVRASLAAAGPFLAATAVYLVARSVVAKVIPHAMAEMPLSWMFLTLPSVLWGYLKLVTWPYPLSIYYETWYVASATDWNFILPCLGLAGAVILLILWAKTAKQGRAVAFACAWLVLPMLPVLDLRLFPAGEIVHDRYLYVSSIGFAILLALAWRQFVPERLRLKGKPLLPVASAAVLAIVLAFGTGLQSVYWANELLLYSHAVAVSPNKAVAKDNLAVAAWDQGMRDAAIRLYKESVRERPSIWLTWYDLGYSYYETGRFVEAEMYLTRALQMNDDHPDTYFVLGLTHYRLGKPDAADLIRRAIQIQPHGLRYHLALGTIYKAQGEYARSLEEFRAELQNDPGQEEAKRQIAEVIAKLGHPGH